MAPTMEVIEQFSQGKRPPGSEDRVVVGAHHVVVIDGASDPTGLTLGGLSGGEWVAQRVADALDSLAPDATAAAAVRLATAAVREELGRVAPERLAPAARRPFCHLVAYARDRREIWRLGDGHFRVGDTVHLGSKEVDDVAYRFRRSVLLAHLSAGADPAHLAEQDPGTVAASALYAEQHRFQNRPAYEPFSYGCIDGVDVDAGHVEIVPVPAGVEVVLASDGYFDLTGDLARAEASLASAVAADPLAVGEPLWRFGKGLKPGNSAPDDRAWVRLRTG
jgi:hypothetical protein